jgi:hypothetical protein
MVGAEYDLKLFLEGAEGVWEQDPQRVLRYSDPLDFRQDRELVVHLAVLRARSYLATEI